jgi:tRNA dimethylallyltransferase
MDGFYVGNNNQRWQDLSEKTVVSAASGDQKKVLIVMGPTASGKTQFSFALSASLHKPCEIISVDSAMIYRGMDIGTAKPDAEELAKLPHHLVDIREPHEVYSVAEFLQDCKETIDAIHNRGAIPILVGGTMMYHQAFQKGLSSLPQANHDLRASYEKIANASGWGILHDRLKTIDAEAATRIHPNDSVRITRALEVYDQTGKTMTSLQQQPIPDYPYLLCPILLMPSSREQLHQRIEKRLDQMFADGLVDEVRALMALPHMHSDLPSMRAVGYKQVLAYLEGDYDEDQMKLAALAATRQFAKRQLTWCRRYFSDVLTAQSDDLNSALQIFKEKYNLD